MDGRVLRASGQALFSLLLVYFPQATTSSLGLSPRSERRIGETPGQGCQSGSKNLLEFRRVFVSFEQRFSHCRKQTGLPYAGNNLRKSHFIMCHVTKYSMILGVFQQPWPGVSPIRHFKRGEGRGDEIA